MKLEKAEDAEVIIAQLPASIILEAKKSNIEDADTEDALAFGKKILAAAVLDENRGPAFDDPSQFDALPMGVQMEIIDAILDFNGLSSKAIEDIEKN